MIVLRDADTLAEMLVMLSTAYVIRLTAAPKVARWLFTVLIAESMYASDADALATVEIPTSVAVVRARPESVMPPNVTSMV